jgi:hypothetical protein
VQAGPARSYQDRVRAPVVQQRDRAAFQPAVIQTHLRRRAAAILPGSTTVMTYCADPNLYSREKPLQSCGTRGSMRSGRHAG